MQQSFSREIALSGTTERAWDLVQDVAGVLRWFSIVEAVREVEPPSRYDATLVDRLGPFKLRAQLQIDVERDADARTIRARASGRDRQIGSRISVDVALSVEPAPDGSLVRVSGDYEVTGRPATLGAASIRKKADGVLDEFAATAARTLA